MAESKLRELSMEFSVDIINLVKYLNLSGLSTSFRYNGVTQTEWKFLY